MHQRRSVLPLEVAAAAVLQCWGPSAATASSSGTVAVNLWTMMTMEAHPLCIYRDVVANEGLQQKKDGCCGWDAVDGGRVLALLVCIGRDL